MSKRADTRRDGGEASEWKNALRRAAEESDVAAAVMLSRDPRPEVRLAVLKAVCPCRVRDDVDALWRRIFEMVSDRDAGVRAQVLHTVCDGSPERLETQVAAALESFNHDEDPDIRRRAHKVLASYLRTGRWNIL
jgi:hypothetical protein